MKYFKFIIVVWFFIACSYASNDTQFTGKSNFNFNNLYENISLNSYNSDEVLTYCLSQVSILNPIWAKNPIWKNDPDNPFPSIEPNSKECGISTQIVGGCTDINNTSDILSKSVFQIARVTSNKQAISFCTAVLISPDFLLTAAHCIADPNSGQYNVNQIFVLSAEKQGGVYRSQDTYVNMVKGAYIPYHYAYYQLSDASPFQKYIHQDFALLKLTHPMSEKYIPLDFARTADLERVLVEKEGGGMFAGYGNNSFSETYNNVLRYRQMYYQGNKYVSQGFSDGPDGYYQQLYISGTKPVLYKEAQSSWTVTANGDSGGPFLLNDSKDKFKIAGILSSAIFCSYPGYFGKVPYTYDAFTSMTDLVNQNLIANIINGTVATARVRCIPFSNDGCDNIKDLSSNMLIGSTSSKKISNYEVKNAGIIFNQSNEETGDFPVQMLFHKGLGIIYVANYLGKSISIYKIDSEMKLKNIGTQAIGNFPVSMFFDDEYSLKVSTLDGQLQEYSILGSGLLRHRRDDNVVKDFMASNPSMKANAIPSSFVLNNYNLKGMKLEPEKILIMATDKTLYISVDDGLMPVRYPATEKLIQVKPAYSNSNGIIYVLFEKGIIKYRIHYKKNTLPAFEQLAKSNSMNFDSYLYMKPISDNAFIVTRQTQGDILLFNINDKGNILLVDSIKDGSKPGQFEIYSNYIYVTHPDSNFVTRYELDKQLNKFVKGSRSDFHTLFNPNMIMRL